MSVNSYSTCYIPSICAYCIRFISVGFKSCVGFGYTYRTCHSQTSSATQYSRTHLPPKTNTQTILAQLRHIDYKNVTNLTFDVFMLILRHLPIELGTLISYNFCIYLNGCKEWHTLVCWNPFQLLTGPFEK